MKRLIQFNYPYSTLIPNNGFINIDEFLDSETAEVIYDMPLLIELDEDAVYNKEHVSISMLIKNAFSVITFNDSFYEGNNCKSIMKRINKGMEILIIVNDLSKNKVGYHEIVANDEITIRIRADKEKNDLDFLRVLNSYKDQEMNLKQPKKENCCRTITQDELNAISL